MRLNGIRPWQLGAVVFAIAGLSGLAHGNPLSALKIKTTVSKPASSSSPPSSAQPAPGSPSSQGSTTKPDPSGPAVSGTAVDSGAGGGSNDIVGLEIGMDQKKIVSLLKKHNPNIEIRMGSWERGKGKITGTSITGLVRPSGPGSISEQFNIALTPDSNAVAYKIYRGIRGSLMRDKTVGELKGKYGSAPLTKPQGTYESYGWQHDSAGRNLPPCDFSANGPVGKCDGILITAILQHYGEGMLASVETTLYDDGTVRAFTDAQANVAQSQQDSQKKQQLEAAKAHKVQY